MADRDDIDTNSRTWRAVMAWAEGRIKSARAAVESPGLDPMQTEYQRGRIVEMKALMDLGTRKETPEADTGFRIDD